MLDDIEKFIEDIRSLSLQDCFNPYRDLCEVHDVEDAPSVRVTNLSRVFERLSGVDQLDIWIGRDLGYRGGRRTGLALTDEFSLPLYAHHLGLAGLTRSTRGSVARERTAANIFEVLVGANSKVLMWNAFPLHPHEPGNPFSNRAHTRKEGAIGLDFLSRLLDIFNVNRLVAIGNDAASGLHKLDRTFEKVRHPSYGGQTEFQRQMADLYGFSRSGNLQLSML